jgi:hypothetical protein
MIKNNITTKPLSSSSITAARISFSAASLFFVLFIALHFIEPEFDPSWRFISEYELGQYGWMMVVAFLSLGVSAGSLLIAIRSQIRTVGGRIGLAFLAISVIGFVMAAIFQTDPITIGKATWHGNLHNVAAQLGGSISLAGLLIGWSLARNKAWINTRRSLLWISAIAVLGWVAALYMSALIAQHHSMFGPSLHVGWSNRVIIIAYGAWLLAFAWHILRLSKR